MATTQTYLQLSPEFGGTKFGPFTGVEIRLGSNPSNNDIVLPEALGVAPEHVRVLNQQDGSYIVAPTTRTATVFVWKADGRPKQITTPTAVGPGDAFSLVTAEGPRFYILLEQPKQAGADTVKPTDDKSKAQELGGGVMAEIKRVGLAKVMTSKVGNFFQTGWRMVKDGTIFSPRYIVMGLMMIVPMVLAGGASCAAIGFQQSAASKDDEIGELKADLDACGGGDEGDPTVASLTQNILGDREWTQTLEADPEFNQSYLKQLKSAFDRGNRYRWVYTRKSSDLTRLLGRLDNDLGPSLSRVFAYIAAHPGFVSDRQWGMIQSNSEGERACGRGPALMTFRQAQNLGVTAQPDALVDAGVAASEDLEVKEAAIRKTLGADEREFELEEIQAEGAGLQGGFQCLYLEGDDDRTEPRALARALGRELGPTSGKNVPDEGSDNWITARLIRYFAADFLIGFDDLDLSDAASASVALDEYSPDQKRFALENAAEVTARAVAIPCLAILEEADAEHLGNPPTLVQCGVLRLLVEREL